MSKKRTPTLDPVIWAAIIGGMVTLIVTIIQVYRPDFSGLLVAGEMRNASAFSGVYTGRAQSPDGYSFEVTFSATGPCQVLTECGNLQLRFENDSVCTAKVTISEIAGQVHYFQLSEKRGCAAGAALREYFKLVDADTLEYRAVWSLGETAGTLSRR